VLDPVSLAAGAGILAIGYLAGRLGKRKARPSRPVNQAVCGCGHPRALHDSHVNGCRGEVSRSRYDSDGDWTGRDWVPCACQRYDGPKPFEELYPSPILPTEIDPKES